MEAKVENIVVHTSESLSSQEKVVHENENYIVIAVLGEENTYAVRNKSTGVVEFKDPQIANVITYAEHGNSFLVNGLWKWVGVQGNKNKEALDKEETGVTFESEMDLDA